MIEPEEPQATWRDLIALAAFLTSIALVGAVLLMVLLLRPQAAHAHDHSHPEDDGWYMTLKSPGGGPCCDMSDSHHVDNLDWETQNKDNSHYRVRIDHQWVDVPDDKVVDGPNRAGFALEWHYYLQGEPIIRCFMPGSMT